MKKGFRNRKLWGLLALLLCVSLAAPAVNVQAASKKSQAIKAYKQFLGSKPDNGSYDFAMIYLDNDSVPELLVGAFLYTYKDGKVTQHSVVFGDSGLSYYKKKGVIVTLHTHNNVIYKEGMQSSDYYKFTKTKLTRKLYKECVYKINASGKAAGKKKYSYSRYNSKNMQVKTTKAKFDSALKQLAGKKKPVKIKLHHNTKANRNKYLK